MRVAESADLLPPFDRTISEEELSLVMKSLGHELKKNEIHEMMEAADTDHNGRIDFEEFKSVMKSV